MGWKSVLKSAVRVSARAGIVLSVLSIGAGLVVDLSGGTTLWSLTPQQLMLFGVLIFVVCAGVIVIWIDLAVTQVNEIFDNDHYQALLRDGIPPYRDQYLHYLRQGNMIVVRRFWDGGMVDFPGEGSASPIHYAIQSDNPLIIQGLVERGVRTDTKNEQGLTPLFITAQQDKRKMVKKLIELDADLDTRCGRHDATALLVAVLQGRHQIVKDLIAAGAKVDVSNVDNVTPLMAALWRSQWEIARDLMDAGAKPDANRPFGLTSIDLLKDPPNDIFERVSGAGVRATPDIIVKGGGSSGDGNITINWERVNESEKESEEKPAN